MNEPAANRTGDPAPDVRVAKLQPKLRMLAGGSTEVNCMRAEHAAAVRVSPDVAKRFRPRRGQASAPDPRAATRPPEPEPPEAAPRADVSVFLGLTSDMAGRRPDDLAGVTSQRADLLTAEVPVEDAVRLRGHSRVSSVELGQPLALPTAAAGDREPAPPDAALRRIAG